MRRKLLLFIIYKVFKTPEGEVMNKFCRTLYKILYPLRVSYEKQSGLRYDFRMDCYFINGIRYSRAIFKWFATDAKEGTLFMFVKREDGVITIKTITTPTKIESN